MNLNVLLPLVSVLLSSSTASSASRTKRGVVLSIGGPGSGKSLSLLNGRILVSLPNPLPPFGVRPTTEASSPWNDNANRIDDDEDDRKKGPPCLSASGTQGSCVNLSDCPGFDIASLYKSICFRDTFVPGVCCAKSTSEKTPPPSSTTSESPFTSTSVLRNDSVTMTTESPKDAGSFGCGIPLMPSFRIVGGDVAAVGQWPWMAAIFLKGFTGRNLHCGGSLVSDQFVLTGAHCMKDRRGVTYNPRQIEVRLGDSDLQSLDDSGDQAAFYRVSRIVTHPEFENINQYFVNDVALLKLMRPLVLDEFKLPICLPPMDTINQELDYFAGRIATVTGFGKTERGIPSKKLLQAEVPIWRNTDCDAAYFPPITDKFICAGYFDGGIDACQGDSGGPLQIEEEGRWIQVGITSFGRGCGEPGYPGVYTRVAKFMNWIKDNMR